MSDFSCDIFKDQNICVVKTLKERITAEEFLTWLSEIVCELTEFKSSMKALFDFRSLRKIEEVSFVDDDESGTYFKDIVQKKMGKKEPRAIIANLDGVYYTTAMWCQVMDIEARTKVFETPEEAFQWLSIEDPSAVGYDVEW